MFCRGGCFGGTTGSATTRVGYWASTVSDHVIYESRLELARLLMADFDKSVNHIVAQPFVLQTELRGKTRRHIPDFLLLTDDGPVVVDVLKPARTVWTYLQWQKRSSGCASLVESMGWSFEAASEQPRVRMENVRFLAGYRRRALIEDSALSQLRTRNLDGVSVGEAILMRCRAHSRWYGRRYCTCCGPRSWLSTCRGSCRLRHRF